MCMQITGDLVKMQILSHSLGVGHTFCICNKLPGGADAKVSRLPPDCKPQGNIKWSLLLVIPGKPHGPDQKQFSTEVIHHLLTAGKQCVEAEISVDFQSLVWQWSYWHFVSESEGCYKSDNVWNNPGWFSKDSPARHGIVPPGILTASSSGNSEQ